MCVFRNRRVGKLKLKLDYEMSKEANVGMTEEQIMSILLTNQYLDTLNTFASEGNQTIFLPNTLNGVDDIRTQILSALHAEKK